jgi:micrococcal nuclease
VLLRKPPPELPRRRPQLPAVEQAARDAEAAAATWTVFHVVDGDTIDVRHADGAVERVRVIGIDSPERGECNFGSATSAMQALVGGREVVLSNGARDDRDRYRRILRYVDVDETDAGLTLIENSLGDRPLRLTGRIRLPPARERLRHR